MHDGLRPPRRARASGRIAAALAAAAFVAAGCSSNAATTTNSTTTTAPPLTSTTTTPPAGAPTVWLCLPGQPSDPCEAPRQATSVSATGAFTEEPAAAPTANARRFACFYVYPTVSSQTTANANLDVQPAEVDAAVSQASRFSEVCQVYAPMYRQRTLVDLAKGLGADPTADTVAYDSLRAGFEDFLAHEDDGRPIVFIGHSQGAAMLIRLLAGVVDPSPTLRRLVVSAIIAGGNVQVPTGKLVGGSFQHLPACTSTSEIGCVIAYSSFLRQPPATSLFGRPGQGVSLQSGQTTSSGEQVLCTNPAALSGGSAPLTSFYVAQGVEIDHRPVTTPWVSYPGQYRAACVSSGGATYLHVVAATGPSDPRPRLHQSLGPNWGLHLDDLNLPLGNLVADVVAEEAAYH